MNRSSCPTSIPHTLPGAAPRRSDGAAASTIRTEGPAPIRHGGRRGSRRRWRRQRPTSPPCDLLRRCLRQRHGRENLGLGTRGAWEELTARYGPLLHRTARKVLRRHHILEARLQPEDVVQEVYLRLLSGEGRRLAAFRGRQRAQTFVYLRRFTERVAFAQVRSLLADKRRRGTRAKNLGPKRLDRLEAESRCARQRVLDRERLRGLLRQCVEVTQDRGRRRDLKILYLAYAEGWDSASIASAVPGAPSAVGVDSMLCRLRQRLARRGITLGRRRIATPTGGRRRRRLRPRRRVAAAA